MSIGILNDIRTRLAPWCEPTLKELSASNIWKRPVFLGYTEEAPGHCSLVVGDRLLAVLSDTIRRIMARVFYAAVSLAVLLPGIFLWTFWHDAKKRSWNYSTESSRTMYVDVAKTLITASGIAIALVASSSTPSRAIDSIVRLSARAGVTSLVVCLCSSLFTIIALTRGHERARSRNIEAGRSGEEGQLNDVELAFILLLAWVGLSSFLVGILFLGRITFHI
jgi:hypothetical protein